MLVAVGWSDGTSGATGPWIALTVQIEQGAAQVFSAHVSFLAGPGCPVWRLWSTQTTLVPSQIMLRLFAENFDVASIGP
ncbi:hypothetical protein [Pseudomonas sp. HAR-UPW-AIA-41]|uniref:hypothetical protein n=1 Tax=Pseudomonas sp. HAR-UPW-AIA-41 TaxID=1985301 RepID=UPI00114352A4|nr:hypothetical protein [Pseudomonas sp. HAR-UPW-AIA-41]